MFIVNGKSHCCNDIFTNRQFTPLLAKIFKTLNVINCIAVQVACQAVVCETMYLHCKPLAYGTRLS